MYVAGKLSRKAERLIKITHDSLMLGVEAVKPGNTFGDIGHAIQSYVESHRMSVVRDFVATAWDAYSTLHQTLFTTGNRGLAQHLSQVCSLRLNRW